MTTHGRITFPELKKPETSGTKDNPMRFWDIFHNGRWIGMSQGETLDKAKEVVKRSLPHIANEIKYAEWFGRFDPRNCKTSGGNENDPI